MSSSSLSAVEVSLRAMKKGLSAATEAVKGCRDKAAAEAALLFMESELGLEFPDTVYADIAQHFAVQAPAAS